MTGQVRHRDGPQPGDYEPIATLGRILASTWIAAASLTSGTGQALAVLIGGILGVIVGEAWRARQDADGH